MTRQARRARGALLRAGRKVFEDKGYYGARVADVAAEAGMAVGSFYTYFDSKEALFREVLIEVEDEVYGELSPAGPQPEDPRARIHQTNLLYFTAFQRNVGFWRAVEESALTNPDARRVLAERRRYYRGRTRRALARWQDRGLIGDDLDLDFAAAALGAMTERCAYLWFIFGDPVAPDEAATKITDLWLTTLGLPG
ncbi:TetR/AcrR family transcriptional regulator [Actinomadura sp. NAK00032]|uniref:TetR/AcrR family transcriptional regulator n=1 Tax=Actinomadura sp. NAK00032 TaxID=2742128 RepID=UPI00159238FE|nr:TetR/AcrR family transcriptional regulator [Actinomadura sp. NAK00032]QKW39351.1 TetR/AcrR family transcriptional regulator [Actinomadura sp. NAK00032]